MERPWTIAFAASLNGVLAEIHSTYKSCCASIPILRVLGRATGRLLQSKPYS